MADAVSTFKAVCRGGLNTGADVLSLGSESSGAAIQLVNYEPNLEGGYRRISGFANKHVERLHQVTTIYIIGIFSIL